MSLKGKEKCTEVENEPRDPRKEDKEFKKELVLFLDKLSLAPKKKKLLVMNLNGFLLQRVHCCDQTGILHARKPDWKYLNFYLYKRPFSEEFMQFCFERFEVGIWSSAMEHNIGAALFVACGESYNKVLFAWDQKKCKKDEAYSLENCKKPMFFKELTKVYDEIKKGGPWSGSNCLMIDDKPYKALFNPSNTAIFPESYDPRNLVDNALDPNGELCTYLKGIANTIDVQTYVFDHPFGQSPIIVSHPYWHYYQGIKASMTQ